MHLPATTPLSQLHDPSLLKTQGFIDGRWVAGAATFAVRDPATGAELAQVAELSAPRNAADSCVRGLI